MCGIVEVCSDIIFEQKELGAVETCNVFLRHYLVHRVEIVLLLRAVFLW